jgi:transcriptional regulator with XRE-family HTH domain
MGTNNHINLLDLKSNEEQSSGRAVSFHGNRPTAHVEILTHTESTARDSLDFLRTELRDDGTPLADSSRADPQRPRDIRSALKVINNVLFEHKPDLTIVHGSMQPQSKSKLLTLVQMEPLDTLAARLKDAMGNEITGSDLARQCGVSPAAVSKWLSGGKMNADNLAEAARAVGVREEWLRTGKLPRERTHGTDERELERAMDMLADLHAPLMALVAVIERLRPSGQQERKRRKP